MIVFYDGFPVNALTQHTTQPALEVNGVVKRFAGVEALASVNLTLPAGQVLALLGPSGCGKTTLLRCIAGLIEPSEGRILISGEEVSGPRGCLPPEARRLGMVFQDYALWPHMTVAENVAFPLTMQGIAKPERQKKVEWALKTVGLQEFASRSPGTLSGGQQQRVALARAIVSEPRLLLMDEPLSNLDKGLREALAVEIRRLIKSLHLTAVFVTHDQHEAYAMADQVAVLHKGVIQQIAPAQVLYRQPATPDVAKFLDAGTLMSATVDAKGLWLDSTLPPLPLCLPNAEQGHLQIMLPRSALQVSSIPSTYPVEVFASVYQGEFYSVTLELSSGGLRLQMLTQGAPVSQGYLHIDLRQIRAWDSNNRAIELRSVSDHSYI